MLATMPHEYVTNIDSHRPATRRLTVRLVTKEVFDFHDRSWRSVLSSLGIHVNLPLRDSHGADLTTLLESGFNHGGDPQHISVMLKGAQAPWYMGHFPAGGSVSP